MTIQHLIKSTAFTGAATLGILSSGSNAATIIQTANASSGVYWNTASLWGGNAPTAGNDYVTASGLVTSAATGLGTGTGITGRVRDNGTTFSGNSLQIVSGTELLLKQNGGQTSTATINLSGGIIRLSPDSAGNAILAGNINVASTSVIGVNQNGASTLNITSTVAGTGNIRLAAGGLATTNAIQFNGDLSGYSGDFIVGGGDQPITLNFGLLYNLPNLDLRYGEFSTADRLNLTNNLSLGSFSYNGSALAAGTYTAAQLNSSFGNGSQFQGSGSLTVIPEPASALLGGLGALVLLRRRRSA